MKTKMLVVACLSGLAITWAGCANQATTTASNTAKREPLQWTHSQEELQKTGRTQTGDALQAVDPSVQTTGH
jgi:PBP1b-binding outer membrane lipoprotein LpoB